VRVCDFAEWGELLFLRFGQRGREHGSEAFRGGHGMRGWVSCEWVGGGKGKLDGKWAMKSGVSLGEELEDLGRFAACPNDDLA